MSALRLQELASEIPRSVFHFLKIKFTAKIEHLAQAETNRYEESKKADGAQKEEHLRLFRPNLANPANKQQTQQLDA